MVRQSELPLDMLVIDPAAELPAYKQLYNAMREAVLAGKLRAGVRLPASRNLARDLSISRNTVISAYETLLAEGYLESRHGSGTFVANLPRSAMKIRDAGNPTAPPPLSRRGRVMGDQPQYSSRGSQTTFHPGYPDVRQFPFRIWSRLLNANLKEARDFTGYSMIGGHPRLKTAIADYLVAARGMKCTPEQIIVVSGTQAGLDLLARMLLDPGDHFWIEQPGYEGAYSALTAAGGRPVPLDVGQEGWQFRPDALPPRAIFVTPSCQWPSGAVMSVDERLTLLELAAQHDAWIIEDDYDSEYRFRGRPVPAMHGLDRSGRVIYLGTFAKTVFPALRIGFLVVPEAIIDSATRAVNITGQYPSLLLQVTLADFISEGSFATHLRRMRSLYAGRQKYFAQLCEEQLAPWLELQPSNAGIQLVGHLKEGIDDGEVLAAALQRNVQFTRLSPLYRHGTPQQGLILGYAANDEAQIRSGIRALQGALTQVAPRPI